jgi:hypothetical protein
MAISDQAAEASRRGAPLLPDDTQVAGGKMDLILRVLGAMKDQPAKVEDGRMPTSVEEGLLQPGEYATRQKDQASSLLSDAGQKRFAEAEGNAAKAIEGNEALDALDEVAGVDPVADVVGQAREGLYGVSNENMTPRAGDPQKPPVTEIDAMGGVQAIQPSRVEDLVRSGTEGIDFNFETLLTGDDVKALFNYTSELYANPIEAAKRGVQTNQMTEEAAEQALADELGFTRRLLKRQTGDLLNASDMLAARQLLIKSGERLTEMARQIRDGNDSPQDLVRFRRQMAIHAGIQTQTKSAQTEIARALQAFNIPASARTPELQADAALELLRATGGPGEARKLAKGLLAAQKNGGSAALHKFAFKGALAKANGVFQEVYVNGLLSWTKTHIKNFFATPLFMLYQLPEELIAGAYGGVERGLRRAFGRKNVEGGVYSGQAIARVLGMSKMLSDALITARRTMDTETPADAMNKIEGAQLRSIDAENLNISGKAGRFVDGLGRAIRIPGRALMAADDFWRVGSQRGELYAEAYAQAMRAKALGKTDEEAFDNFAMSILDPRSFAGQMDDAARYNTMTSDLGKVGELARTLQEIPFLGKMIMPFVVAPTNSILRWMERINPIAFTKDPAKRQRALARATMGWGVMYTVYQHALNGNLTGSMPRDKRQREMLPPGWQPYSLVFRGDDFPVDSDGDPLPLFDPRTGMPNGALTYVSYAGLEPVGAILGIAASTAEKMRRSNDPEISLRWASAAAAAAAEYISDMPMLKTIGDMELAWTRGDMSYLASSPLQSFLPGSALIRAGERGVNPTSRRAVGKGPEYYTIADVQNPDIVPFHDVGGGKSEPRYELVGRVKGGMGASFNDAMDKWGSMISDREVFGGADDDTSAIQYDVFGKPKEMNVRFDVNPVLAGWNAAMPFTIKKGEAPNALQREQMRLKGPLREKRQRHNGFVFPEAFAAKWTNLAKNVIKTVSPQGNAETFNEALNALIGTVEYARSTDKEQFNAIQDIEDRFYESALPVLLTDPAYENIKRAYDDLQQVKGTMSDLGRLRR